MAQLSDLALTTKTLRHKDTMVMRTAKLTRTAHRRDIVGTPTTWTYVASASCNLCVLVALWLRVWVTGNQALEKLEQKESEKSFLSLDMGKLFDPQSLVLWHPKQQVGER